MLKHSDSEELILQLNCLTNELLIWSDFWLLEDLMKALYDSKLKELGG